MGHLMRGKEGSWWLWTLGRRVPYFFLTWGRSSWKGKSHLRLGSVTPEMLVDVCMEMQWVWSFSEMEDTLKMDTFRKWDCSICCFVTCFFFFFKLDNILWAFSPHYRYFWFSWLLYTATWGNLIMSPLPHPQPLTRDWFMCSVCGFRKLRWYSGLKKSSRYQGLDRHCLQAEASPLPTSPLSPSETVSLFIQAGRVPWPSPVEP